MRRSDRGVLFGICCVLLLASASFAQPKQALFHARLDDQGQVSLAFEAEIAARLQMLGYELTIVDDQWSTRAAAAAGKDLIYVAESGSSSNADVYKDMPIPAIMSEAYGWDNWDWAIGTSSWVDNQTQIDITNPTHPLAAGLSGAIDVYSSPVAIQQKAIAELTAPGVVVIAALSGAGGTTAVLVGVEAGGQLLNGRTAPARQVGFFFGAGTGAVPGVVTADGWRLFDAAVRWADPLALPTQPLNLTARRGDGAVELTWQAASGFIDGYRIHQSELAGGPYSEVTTTTLLTHTVTGLTNGTTYYFVVTAFNDSGDGPASNEALATPQSGVSLRSWRWEKYD